MTHDAPPRLLVLNQMAGPMTWELVVDLVQELGPIALLTGHPDSLKKQPPEGLTVSPAAAYQRGGHVTRFWSWMKYTCHAVWWLWRKPAQTPILLFSNPPIALWIVHWIHCLRGTPYVVMVHDIFPDVLVRKGVVKKESMLTKFWLRRNQKAFAKSNAVMTLGVYMAETLRRQLGDSTDGLPEIVVIPPWSDGERIQPLEKTENWFAKKHDQVGKLTCMYSGNMGLGHDLKSMWTAAKRLVDHDSIRFMFIGAGPKWPEVQQAKVDLQLSNVTVLGWLPEDDLPWSLATADIGLVSLEDELTGLAVPSKAYYFLAAHVPVIALCDDQTELAELIRTYDCGAVIRPGQPYELVKILHGVASDPSIIERWRHGAAQAHSNHRRSALTKAFADSLTAHIPSLQPAQPPTE